jgi:hypothetical protein
MVLNKSLLVQQKEICLQYGAIFCASHEESKVGIANNVNTGLKPINGLRHPMEGDTTGWYIWAGDELSNDADFFKPVHVMHMPEISPDLMKYLGLPPGWRFLFDDSYLDIWYDDSLLRV